MTRNERKLLLGNAALGVGLTILIVIVDVLGWLRPLELWTYDERVRRCQNFTPPPTTDLIHLDIDDSSINLVGRWPWPREVWADIADELTKAGAKTLAMDVLLSESQSKESPSATQPSTEVDAGDAAFAAALGRFGNAVLPVSFAFEVPAPSRLLEELIRDPQQTFEEVRGKVTSSTGRPIKEGEYVDDLKKALATRIALDWPNANVPLEQVRQALLPNVEVNSPPSRFLAEEYNRHRAMRALRRLIIAKPVGFPPLLRASGELPPLPELSISAAQGGFVNYVSDSDNVVRHVPLWAESNGRLLPHLGLAMAMAHLNIDPTQVRLTPDAAYLPRPGFDDIAIPVETIESKKFGPVGMFMNIPYLGNEAWLYGLDYPAHATPKQHMPAGQVWGLVGARTRARRNAALTDDALIFALLQFAPEDAKEYLAKAPDLDDFSGREKRVEKLLADEFVQESVKMYKAMSPDELAKLPERDQRMAAVLPALQRLVTVNRAFAEQIARQEAELRNAVQGRAVLVGWTATGATDFVRTSLHAICPGVVVHGAVFNAIMTRYFLVDAPPWVTRALIVVIGLLCTAGAARLSSFWAALMTAALVGGYTLINAILLFDRNHVIVGLASPVVAGVGVWACLTLNRFITERTERNRITRRFRSYVDPKIVNYVIENPEIETFKGESREMTVVFTDLAGFTELTEKLRERSVEILREYLARMVPIIQRNNGLVNKFLGDGIMFFYGAPVPSTTHAADAVRTVLEMQHALAQFNEELKALGSPTVAMRAGISTGSMIVGDAGPQQRSDYTVLGDSVNLGSRLESANKYTGSWTLITQRTRELIGTDQFVVRPIARLRVVGKNVFETVYEPLALRADANETTQQVADASSRVAERFFGGQFQECLLAIDAMEREHGLSDFLVFYRDHCFAQLADPDPAFDGAITLTSK